MKQKEGSFVDESAIDSLKQSLAQTRRIVHSLEKLQPNPSIKTSNEFSKISSSVDGILAVLQSASSNLSELEKRYCALTELVNSQDKF